MRVSYNWLKEYIDLKEPPEKLAGMLTMSGSEVKSVDAAEDGIYVMDIEITPNRRDCLSYIGIAREISALTGRKIKMPSSLVKGRRPPVGAKAEFAVEIKDRDLCPRYTARLIKNVSVKDSPEWLKKKLALMGLRPVNNAVDITNFVLFETGQPMHVFDYDKIRGRKIIVRKAAEGAESIVSIDNVKRRLEKDALVIADEERPIAVAGVMGGLDTEVNFSTKNILLESAYFNPVSVRKTSHKLALASESSYRFERGIDPGMVMPASDRAAFLIQELCGGEIAGLADKGARPAKDRVVAVRISRLNAVLNLKLTRAYVKKMLAGLSFRASSAGDIIKAVVPSFRQDIESEIDIIEEAARIYGYEKTAATLPNIAPSPERKPFFWQVKEKAAETLVSLGLSEVITYGLASRAYIQKVFGSGIPGEITVKNYINAEQEVMRPSLLPGVLAVLSWNMSRGARNLKLFEIGNVYRMDYHYESAHLLVALTGLLADDWQRPKSRLALFDLKGMLDALFSKLGLLSDKVEFSADAPLPPFAVKGKAASVFYDRQYMGYLAALDKKVIGAFDLTEDVFAAEMDLGRLSRHADLTKRFREIPKYPSIKRDVSLTVPGGVAFAQIRALALKAGGKLVENIELLDRYSGKQVPENRQGLAFRVEYRDKTRTLTAEEVDKIHLALRDALVEKLGAALR